MLLFTNTKTSEKQQGHWRNSWDQRWCEYHHSCSPFTLRMLKGAYYVHANWTDTSANPGPLTHTSSRWPPTTCSMELQQSPSDTNAAHTMTTLGTPTTGHSQLLLQLSHQSTLCPEHPRKPQAVSASTPAVPHAQPWCRMPRDPKPTPAIAPVRQPTHTARHMHSTQELSYIRPLIQDWES